MGAAYKYWYLLFGVVVAVVLVIFRMHKRGGTEPTFRRIVYVLFPHTDPMRSPQVPLSPLVVVLIGGGFLLFVFAYLLFLQSH
jgi:hypothetical protein